MFYFQDISYKLVQQKYKQELQRLYQENQNQQNQIL